MASHSAIPRFDVYAETYEENVAENGYGIVRDSIKWTSPFVTKHNRLLDIGIGTGNASKPYADEGWHVTGVDGSIPMLERAHEKKFAAELIRCDISSGELPLHGNPFELIVCAGVLEFVIDLYKFSKEVARLSSPDIQALALLVVRDITLNPHFSVMEYNGLKIDENAYRNNDLIAVHYSSEEVVECFAKHNFYVLDDKRTFTYRSPTQDIDTQCRVLILARDELR